MKKTYYLPKEYQINTIPEYYLDEIVDETLVWQPQVYSLGLEMMLSGGIKNLIDIGSGNGKKLKPFLDAGINVHVFDFGDNLKFIAQEYSSYENINLYECNLEFSIPELDDTIIWDSIIIASDVIEHIIEPNFFLKLLSAYSKKAPLIFISTPDRDKIRGYGSLQSPENKAHVREWNLNEFICLLKEYSITNTLCGYTTVNNKYIDRSTLLVLSGSNVIDTLIDKKEITINIAIILYLKNDDIHNYEWHLKFWEKQNIDLYFIINKCENQQILRDKLESDHLTNYILKDADEFNTKEIQWLLESDFSSYLTSNFPQNPSLRDIVTFVDHLGYTVISFREEEYFNNYFTLTNRIKSIQKKNTISDLTYPIFLKKTILLNQINSCMLIDSLQNRYLYLGDILSRDLRYFNETFQNELVKLKFEDELTKKEMVISNFKDELVRKEVAISNFQDELLLIKNSIIWRATKQLHFILKMLGFKL